MKETVHGSGGGFSRVTGCRLKTVQTTLRLTATESGNCCALDNLCHKIQIRYELITAKVVRVKRIFLQTWSDDGSLTFIADS